MAGRSPGVFARVYAVVRRVPRGRVASYGQVARIVGPGCHARLVGYALAATPADVDIPWQRIVNREGRITLPGEAGELQRALLEAEGVALGADGRVDLTRFGWSGQATSRARRRRLRGAAGPRRR